MLERGVWRRAHEIQREIYDRHAAGCCLHIVIDDGNVDDVSVGLSIVWALQHRHALCTMLGEFIAALTMNQRRRFCRPRASRGT